MANTFVIRVETPYVYHLISMGGIFLNSILKLTKIFSMDSENDSIWGMIVGPTKCVARRIPTSHNIFTDAPNIGWGVHLNQDYRRPVVSRGKRITHKTSRIKSSDPSPKVFHTPVQGDTS